MNLQLFIFSCKRAELTAGVAYTDYVIMHQKEKTGLPPLTLTEFSKKYNSSFAYMRIKKSNR